MTFAQGDLNGDGNVNGSDFALLAGNFGNAVPAPGAVRSGNTVGVSEAKAPAAQVLRRRPPPPARRARPRPRAE
jgi:hypothetical protein